MSNTTHLTEDGEGRDPRTMTVEEFNGLGHEKMSLIAVIRAKCLDCSHTSAEVLKCTSIDCALWPYRARTNPFSTRIGNPEAVAALAAWRERQALEGGAK